MASEFLQPLRALTARPTFTAVVVLTLGLGLGANAAIFSAVQALLLRPFPFPNADRLVRISTVRGGEEGGLAVPEQDDLAALTDVVEEIALYTDQGMYNASGFGEPEELQATITTHNLFRVLGIMPAIGTVFPAGADRSRRFELVISHGLWVRRFGQDPNIVGRTMTLDGAPGYTIHGVLPPEVNFPTNSDLFRSAGISADPATYRRRDLRGRMGLARLKSGVTIAQARGRIEALGDRLAREFPETNRGLQFHVTPLRDLYIGNVRPYIILLFGAVDWSSSWRARTSSTCCFPACWLVIVKWPFGRRSAQSPAHRLPAREREPVDVRTGRPRGARIGVVRYRSHNQHGACTATELDGN